MVTHHEAMALALKLAKKGSGQVSPNPMVGAVIMNDNGIVSTGFHHKFGGIHAEIDAITKAGDIDFSDCTLAVNLEPCSHQGKQPPCAERIASLGFKEIVVGMLDPNPLVSGKGIDILREAGIQVVEGVLEMECKWLNRAFIKHITTGLPYVVAKTAQSLNGAISTASGDSKWISSEASRKAVHKMRAELDAVLVGKITALLDNPELTVRHIEGRNPFRLIADTHLTLPHDLKLLTDELRNKTIVICSSANEDTEKSMSLLEKGISLLFVDTDSSGRIDFKQAFEALYQDFNIGSVLVEGGSQLLNGLLANSLIDEYHFFIAPKIIPGGVCNFDGEFNIENMSEAKELKIIDSRFSGVDLHIIAKNK